MFIHPKIRLTIVLLAALAAASCDRKDVGTPNPATTPTPTAPPLTPGTSGSLTRSKVTPQYVIDSFGPIKYPEQQKSNQISADADTAIVGWALDKTSKKTAGGVDMVIDQSPFNARYGIPRGDVADHFQHPDYINSGFQLVIPRGRLTKGDHTLSIRVISSDRTSYDESPPVKFTVN